MMDNESDVRDFVSHWRMDPTGRDDELVVAKVKYESVARVARWRSMKRAARDEDEDAAQGIVEDENDHDGGSPGGFSDSERQHLRQHWTQERSPLRHVRPHSASTSRRVGELRDGAYRVGQRRPLSASASRPAGDVSSPQRKLQQLKEFAWMPAAIQRSKWTEMLHSSPSFQEQSLQRLEAETYALLKQVLEKRPASRVKRDYKPAKSRKSGTVETGTAQFIAGGGRSLAAGSGLQVVRKSKSRTVKADTTRHVEKEANKAPKGGTKKAQPAPVQATEKKPEKVGAKAKKQKPMIASHQSRGRTPRSTADEMKLTEKELKKRHADAEARLRLMQEMGWLDDVGLRKSPRQTDIVPDTETSPTKKPKKKKKKLKSAKTRLEAVEVAEEASRQVSGQLTAASDNDVDCLLSELLLEMPRDACCAEAALSREVDVVWPDSPRIRRDGGEESASLEQLHDGEKDTNAQTMAAEGEIEANGPSQPDIQAASIPVDEDVRVTETLAVVGSAAKTGEACEVAGPQRETAVVAVSSEDGGIERNAAIDTCAPGSDGRCVPGHLSRSNTDRYEDDVFEDELALGAANKIDQADDAASGQADGLAETAETDEKSDDPDQVTATEHRSNGVDCFLLCGVDCRPTTMDPVEEKLISTPTDPDEITVNTTDESHPCEVEAKCSTANTHESNESDEQPLPFVIEIPPSPEPDGSSEAARRIQCQYRVFMNRRLLLDQVAFLAQKQRRQKRKMSRRASGSDSYLVAEAVATPPTTVSTPIAMECETSSSQLEVGGTTSVRVEEPIGRNEAAQVTSINELQEGADKEHEIAQPKPQMDCDFEASTLHTSVDNLTTAFVGDDNDRPCLDIRDNCAEASQCLASTSSHDFHQATEVQSASEVARDCVSETQDTTNGAADPEMASLRPTGPTSTIEVLTSDDADGTTASTDSLSAVNDTLTCQHNVEQGHMSLSGECEAPARAMNPVSPETREKPGMDPQDEDISCHEPASQAPLVPVELDVPSSLVECSLKANDDEEHDPTPRGGGPDHGDSLLVDAVGGDGSAANEAPSECDPIDLSSSTALTEISEETASVEVAADGGNALPVDSRGIAASDHDDPSEQDRAKAAERIRQCWKDHRCAHKKDSAGDEHGHIEEPKLALGAAETLTVSADALLPATGPLQVEEVNTPAPDEDRGLPSQPGDEEPGHVDLSESSLLITSLDPSNATALGVEPVVYPERCEFVSADETSVSVADNQGILDERSVLTGAADEAVRVDGSVESSLDAQAVVRIQRQYRRFVYRRALLDQLAFFVRQHRRETRRKTRRLSAEHTDGRAMLAALNAEVRAEGVPQPTIAGTSDAELQPTSPAPHLTEEIAEVGGLAEMGLLEAAFESAAEERAKEETTQAADGDTTMQEAEDATSLNSAARMPDDELVKVADGKAPHQQHESAGDKRDLTATWERYIDSSANKSFYFHATRRISQWDRPADAVVVDKTTDQLAQPLDTAVEEASVTPTDGELEATHEPRAEASSPNCERWERYMDSDTNKSFYFHPKRKVSRWDRPVEEPVVDCVAAAPQGELLTEEPRGQSDGADAHTDEASQVLSWWRQVKEQATLLETNGGWARYLTREDAVVFYHHAERDEFRLERDSGAPVEFTQAKTALLSPVLEPTGEDKSSRWTLRRNRSLKGDKRGEWQAFVDTETHQTFYYNTLTGESTWEKPTAFQQPTGDSSASYEWVMYVDPTTSQPYYVNLVTNATSWEKPPDFDQATSDQNLSRLRGIGEHSDAVAAAAPMAEDEDADVEHDEYVISIHDDRGADEWLAA